MYSTRSSLSCFLALVGSLVVGCSAPFNATDGGMPAGGAADDSADAGAGRAGSAPDKNAPTAMADDAGTPEKMPGRAGPANAPTTEIERSDPLPLDAPAPRVLQTSPSDGAVAVSPRTRVFLRFSQPMDEAATEAALAIAGPSEVTWSASWQESGTLLSLTPAAPLASPHVILQGDQALEVEAPTYTLTLGEGAVDLQGRHLSAFSLHFQTPRHVTHTLPAVEALSGVLRGESGRLYGFLTYDLGALAGNGRRVSSVILHGGEKSVAAAVPLYAMDFSELTPAAISAPGQLIATVPAGTHGDVALVPEVFGLFDGRDAAYLSRGRYAQVRMVLPEDESNAWAEAATAALRASSLEVDYLLP